MNEYFSQRVNFKSCGHVIQGILFIPKYCDIKHPAITIIGPVSYVKEQAPIQYATRLAKNGFITLIYDPSYYGYSEGEPRCYESGHQKEKDIKASIDFLESVYLVDKKNIFSFAMCQGVNWMIKAYNSDPRIKLLSLIAGHYLTPETANIYCGTPQKLKERLELAQIAKNAFQQNGSVSYIPVVGIGNETKALLRHKTPYDWYKSWEGNDNGLDFRGKWKNQITQMSELDIWQTDISKDMKNIKKPVFMIHSDNAASGKKIPEDLFQQINSEEKKIEWIGQQSQIQFYEDVLTIDYVVNMVSKWFYLTM